MGAGKKAARGPVPRGQACPYRADCPQPEDVGGRRPSLLPKGVRALQQVGGTWALSQGPGLVPQSPGCPALWTRQVPDSCPKALTQLPGHQPRPGDPHQPGPPGPPRQGSPGGVCQGCRQWRWVTRTEAAQGQGDHHSCLLGAWEHGGDAGTVPASPKQHLLRAPSHEPTPPVGPSWQGRAAVVAELQGWGGRVELGGRSGRSPATSSLSQPIKQQSSSSEFLSGAYPAS